MTTRNIPVHLADLDALLAIRGVIADAAHHPGRAAAIEALDRLKAAWEAQPCTCEDGRCKECCKRKFDELGAAGVRSDGRQAVGSAVVKLDEVASNSDPEPVGFVFTPSGNGAPDLFEYCLGCHFGRCSWMADTARWSCRLCACQWTPKQIAAAYEGKHVDRAAIKAALPQPAPADFATTMRRVGEEAARIEADERARGITHAAPSTDWGTLPPRSMEEIRGLMRTGGIPVPQRQCNHAKFDAKCLPAILGEEALEQIRVLFGYDDIEVRRREYGGVFWAVYAALPDRQWDRAIALVTDRDLADSPLPTTPWFDAFAKLAVKLEVPDHASKLPALVEILACAIGAPFAPLTVGEAGLRKALALPPRPDAVQFKPSTQGHIPTSPPPWAPAIGEAFEAQIDITGDRWWPLRRVAPGAGVEIGQWAVQPRAGRPPIGVITKVMPTLRGNWQPLATPHPFRARPADVAWPPSPAEETCADCQCDPQNIVHSDAAIAKRADEGMYHVSWSGIGTALGVTLTWERDPHGGVTIEMVGEGGVEARRNISDADVAANRDRAVVDAVNACVRQLGLRRELLGITNGAGLTRISAIGHSS